MKVEKISQFVSSPEKMLKLTGFADGTSGGDLTKDLFQLVGLLELYSSAYLEADGHFMKAHSNSEGPASQQHNRLLGYLQLVS